ncbi:MAG: hypothetical protein ABI644_15025 [Arenimonas sp.]
MKAQYWAAVAVCMLTIFLSSPINAQGGANLTPPDLTKLSLPDLPKPPVPTDENGNPIQPHEATAEELEAARLAAGTAQKEFENKRLEEEKRVADEIRLAEEKRRTDELLAEEKQFHDRVMWAIYIGLGILVIFIGQKIFKRSE